MRHSLKLGVTALLLSSLGTQFSAASTYLAINPDNPTPVPYDYGEIPFLLWGVGMSAYHIQIQDPPAPPEEKLSVTHDLSVYGTARVLHIMEFCAYADNVPDHVPAGHITVYYQDGTTSELDLIVGENTAEWAYEGSVIAGCLQHTAPTPAYSYDIIENGVDQGWDGHLFYVSMPLDETKLLDRVELVIDPASYTGQMNYGCSLVDWFGVNINGLTLEDPEFSPVNGFVDNFQPYAPGNASSASPPWMTTDDGGTGFYGDIVSDPFDSYNQVLSQYGNGDKRDLSIATPVAITSLGSLSFDVLVKNDTGVDHSFGLTQEEGMSEESDYGPYIRVIEYPYPGTVQLSVRDGDEYADAVAILDINRWYRIELVVDTAGGDAGNGGFRVYVDHDLVYANADFLRDYSEPLDVFCMLAGGGALPENVLVDNIRITARPTTENGQTWWRFEAGPDGADVTHATAEGVFSADVLDSTGHGNDLSIWSSGGYAGYAYRSDTPGGYIPQTGEPNQFSVQNTGDFPCMFTSSDAPIHTITPLAWTIEVAFQPMDNSNWRTLVGRDSQGTVASDRNLAALYLQITPEDKLAIKFGDVSGCWHEAISESGLVSVSDPPAIGQWQAAAAVCDGTTLKLYYKNIEAGDEVYSLVAETDLTLSGSPDTHLTAGAGWGGFWTHGTWSVGRGFYAGQHTDRAYGFIDEVRISDTALMPEEFLFPESGIYLCELPDFGGGFSEATAVNESRLVVGFSRTTSGDIHAFLYNDNTKDMTDLGLLAGKTQCHATDINASGWIVGYCSDDIYGGNPRAFRIVPQDSDMNGVPDVWFADGNPDGANALMEDLGDLGGGQSWAASVNDDGKIVGRSKTASGDWHAFIWTPEAGMLDLGTLGGNSSIANAINSDGVVAGTATTPSGETHAFLITPIDTNSDGIPDTWTAGPAGGVNEFMVDLGCPDPLAPEFGVHGVSQTPGVAAFTILSPSDWEGWIWMPESGWNLVDNLGGGSTLVNDMNDPGHFAGGSQTTIEGGLAHGYLGTLSGGLLDLGALTEDSGSLATDVSPNSELLAGVNQYPDGAAVPVLWHIVPNTDVGIDVVIEHPVMKKARLKLKVVKKKGYTKIEEIEEMAKLVELPPAKKPVSAAMEIATSAEFEDKAEVSLKYDPLKVTDKSKLELWHLKKKVWKKEISKVDILEKAVSAEVESLSPFIVLEDLNLVPEVDPIETVLEPVAVGVLKNTSANFRDGNPEDLHTAVWVWGDGTTSEGVVTESGGAGVVEGGHAYSVPGVYTVELTVTDTVGGSATVQLQYIVVYDTAAGFVTGGGWILSPPGAFHPDQETFRNVTGKASFGFVGKYQKGVDVPTGNTEFRFKAGELDFKSTAYQWLVVAGARAQFKGWGTINGEGKYPFMLTAIDGDLLGGSPPDRFRIKIGDMDADAVIYDNQNGTDDTSDLDADGTLVRGGSIVVHKK